MPISAGQVLDGKYRIVRVIGEGGMGVVYEGENVLIRRRVAIKVLHAQPSANEDVLRRFEREAQAAGEIGSDHILEVLDLGALPSGERYMVMEYLDGETLSQRMQRLGRLTPSQVATIAAQFLEGLASAHAAGIIHRDLKPDNIFITKAKAGRVDFVKIIDFGISKFSRNTEQLKLTRQGAMMGTPCYMSPEQARGLSEADVRSDIYAVGVILYEAVTGRLPFEADNFNDLMFKIALSDPPRPREIVPELDPGFETIILTAMSRDPAHRYPGVEGLATAIAPWCESPSVVRATPGRGSHVSTSELRAAPHAQTLAAEGLDAVGVDMRPSALDVVSGTDRTWAQTSGSSAPARRWRVPVGIGASVVAVALVILGVVRFSRTSGTGRAAPAPPVERPATMAAPANAGTATSSADRDTHVPDSNSAADAGVVVATVPVHSRTGGAAPQATAPAATTRPRPSSTARPAASRKTPSAPDFGY